MDLSHSCRVVAVSFLLVSSAWGRGASDLGMIEGTAKPRVLHFPADRSLGKLMSREAKPEEPISTFHYWSGDADWEFLGQAQGDVAVPAGHQVFLVVWQARGWRDLSPLRGLRADDLYRLTISGPRAGGRAGDSCMQHVGHLTGMTHLKDLHLFGCDKLTDESITTIAGFQFLDSLDIGHGRLTVSGLKPPNRLTNLKNLKLHEIVQDNSGLDLSGLANLRDLSLHLAVKQGDGGPAMFQEQDIAAIGRVTNLRRLQVSHSGIPDDRVMRHLAGLTHLERLSIGGNGLTDEGMAYLAQLPNLSSLTLSGTFTDSALIHLRKLQNLTLLDFMSGANFTPRALSDFRAAMPHLITYCDFERR